MSRALTCRAHCAACGRHFTGIEAFDLHPVGGFDRRACADPALVVRRDGSAALAAVQGVCRLGGSPKAAAGAAAFRAARPVGRGRDECCAAAEHAGAEAPERVDEHVALWQSARPGRAEVAVRARAIRQEAIPGAGGGPGTPGARSGS